VNHYIILLSDFQRHSIPLHFSKDKKLLHPYIAKDFHQLLWKADGRKKRIDLKEQPSKIYHTDHCFCFYPKKAGLSKPFSQTGMKIPG